MTEQHGARWLTDGRHEPAPVTPYQCGKARWRDPDDF